MCLYLSIFVFNNTPEQICAEERPGEVRKPRGGWRKALGLSRPATTSQHTEAFKWDSVPRTGLLISAVTNQHSSELGSPCLPSASQIQPQTRDFNCEVSRKDCSPPEVHGQRNQSFLPIVLIHLISDVTVTLQPKVLVNGS